MSDATVPDRFDVAAFLSGLDAIFEAREGITRAEPYLRAALVRAEETADGGARLTVLNELTGFLRSVSRHDRALAAADEAVALADELGLAGSDALATTLINAATAHRAAGRHDAARTLYDRALAAARATMAPQDRRLAALHNNRSMLCSETEDAAGARTELLAALRILEASSVDPARDVDLAATCTNLALACYSLGLADEAAANTARAMAVYRNGGHEASPHFASALAGQGEACFRMGRFAEAVESYRSALAIIAECYGAHSDAYRVTAANLAEVEEAARGAARGAARAGSPEASPTGVPPTPEEATPSGTGLDIARAYWETYGRELLGRYPELAGRAAVGLVGHGSECYGFDDALSRDHDFGPGFCVWLTAEDHARFGAQLQADYEALPQEFAGVGPRVLTPRAQGTGRRVGVFEIGAFYSSITGYRDAPGADHPHEWLLLDEATLAAATNGAVFADPLGAFGGIRTRFRRMPRDVRLALVSRRLGMVSQAGQYNVPRMLERGDGEAAWLAVAEFVRSTASLVFLLNGPASAGYLPYYKWQFAALRRLSRRMGSRLPQVVDRLSDVLRLASAACFGGAGFGEGGRGAGPAREQLVATIEAVCADVVAELRRLGLTRSEETFLEWQRPWVEEGIEESWLRSR